MVHNFQSFLSVFTQIMRKIRREVTRKVIPVYDAAGNVIETHEHKGDFKEP